MKIILPGGSGQVGTILARYLHERGHQVVVLSRTPKPTPWKVAEWDGRTRGRWVEQLEYADAVIHLSGRSVNCRYTAENRKEIYESRTVPTRMLGEVIAGLHYPPRVWLNASTATLYRHALDRAQDEFTGDYARRTGGPPTVEQPGLPETWAFSADVGMKWEEALRAVPTPKTRKIALRTSMVMSEDADGVFSVLSGLVRKGLGGTQGPGTQYVAWIHEQDFARAVDLLLAQPEIADDTNGIVNMAAPNPVPNKEFMRLLREAWGVGFGLPAATWMLEIGAVFLRTETELILKSRRVVPAVLERSGFTFDFPGWAEAARDLVGKMKVAKMRVD